MKRYRSVSFVWTHYDKDRNEATCKICKKVIKLCGNTTNLREHLKRLHNILEDPAPAAPSTSSSSDADPVPQKKERQTKLIVNSVSELKPAQIKRIDNAVLKMAFTDHQPLCFVEDKGFLEFVEVLQCELLNR